MQSQDKQIYLKFLKFLKSQNKNQLKEFFKYANDEAINIICRCLNTIQYEDIGLLKNKNPPSLKKLKTIQKIYKKHKEPIDILLKYSKKKIDLNKKREILSGGAFPLIPLLLSAIPPLISAITKS